MHTFLSRLAFKPRIWSPSASATTSPSLEALSSSLPTSSTLHGPLSCLGPSRRIPWSSPSWEHCLSSILWCSFGHDEKIFRTWPRYGTSEGPFCQDLVLCVWFFFLFWWLMKPGDLQSIDKSSLQKWNSFWHVRCARWGRMIKIRYNNEWSCKLKLQKEL